MSSMRSFQDNGRTCFANLRMDDGAPCFISVARSGVLVKKSKTGLTGAKLYNETDISRVAKTTMALLNLYPDQRAPAGITNPVLMAFVNAALHCSDLAQVTRVFNQAISDAEK